MPIDLAKRRLTARDVEILLALDRCPLTVQQLLKLSQTFREQRFASPRSVQDRLQKLRQAGWVRRWPLATTSRGGLPDYCKLTLLGYRLLYGASAKPPTKRYFYEVALAHQHHTHSLSEIPARRELRPGQFRRTPSRPSGASGNLHPLPAATCPLPREPRSSGLPSPTS